MCKDQNENKCEVFYDIYREYMSTTLLKHNHVFSIVSSYVQSKCSDHRRDLLNITVEIPGEKLCLVSLLNICTF